MRGSAQHASPLASNQVEFDLGADCPELFASPGGSSRGSPRLPKGPDHVSALIVQFAAHEIAMDSFHLQPCPREEVFHFESKRTVQADRPLLPSIREPAACTEEIMTDGDDCRLRGRFACPSAGDADPGTGGRILDFNGFSKGRDRAAGKAGKPGDVLMIHVNHQTRVPGKVALNALQTGHLIGSRKHVLERVASDYCQTEPMSQVECAHVSQNPSGIVQSICLLTRNLQHLGRAVDANDVEARPGQPVADTASAARYLENRRTASGGQLTGKAFVEGHLPRPIGDQRVVQPGV